MATKYLSALPNFQAFDANGDPLASGNLYLYLAGTTTPATTYSDATGTTNASPVVLDSSGQCNLWLTAGLTYDVRLTSSVGYLIYTGQITAPVTPGTYFATLMVMTTQMAVFNAVVAQGGTITGAVNMKAAFNEAVPVTIGSATSTPIGAQVANSVTVYPSDGVYFDPLYKSTTITLSNNNSTATSNTATYGTVLGVVGKSTGKWYFEVRIDVDPNSANFLIGVATRSATLVNFLGFDAYGWCVAYSTGSGNPYQKYHSNSFALLGLNSGGAGTIIGVALDLDLGEIRAYKNNATLNLTVPIYTGLTGPLYIALTAYEISDAATLRTQASEMSYTPPSGYTVWGSS